MRDILSNLFFFQNADFPLLMNHLCGQEEYEVCYTGLVEYKYGEILVSCIIDFVIHEWKLDNKSKYLILLERTIFKLQRKGGRISRHLLPLFYHLTQHSQGSR